MTTALPRRLFHYTNAAGLIGILSSKALWATDILFMNDAKEFIFASAEIIGELDSKIRDLEPSLGDDHWDPIRNRIGQLESVKATVQAIAERTFNERMYVTCFCANGDLLSQWRGYAGFGGCALGFRPTALGAVDGNLYTAQLVSVSYGEVPAKRKIQGFLRHIGDHPVNHPGTVGWHNSAAVQQILASLKHEAFQEEAEWRTIIASHVLSGISGDQASDAARGRIAFRTGENSIVPYVSRPFDPAALEEIVIGPGPDSRLRGLAVEQAVSRYLGLSSEVQISYSSVPLR